MGIKFTPEELAAMVRSRERLNAVVRWTAVSAAGLLALGFLYNVWLAEQPWIRFSQAWTFGVVIYLLGAGLGRRSGENHAQESAVQFLERQHKERAKGYLRLRSLLWLIIPSIAGSWLGGGPLVLAKARGLNPSSWPFQFCAGPWPFLLVLVLLAVVWLLFGGAAAKARRDIQELRRSIGA